MHHAPGELSTLTQNRRHLIERVYMDVALYLPILVVLGIPSETWPILWMVFGMLEALQHAELDWRFGPLYYVFVSPVFHSLHHSSDPRYYDKNLGGMFSIWDHLFGTAAGVKERPEEYGVPGLTMKETLTSQLVTPFKTLTDSDPPSEGSGGPASERR